MSRPPNIIPSVALKLKLPEDLRGKLDLYLYSESEGCVPKGSYQRFFVTLINEFFNRQAKPHADT